jgi:hypothetical protein
MHLYHRHRRRLAKNVVTHTRTPLIYKDTIFFLYTQYFFFTHDTV